MNNSYTSISPNNLKTLTAFFAGRGDKRVYPTQELLLGNGENPNRVYLLTKGFVRLYLISERGQETTLHIIKPGEVFPLIATLGQVPNRYNYETWGDVEVMDAPVSQFQDFLKNEKDLLFDLNCHLLKRISGLLLRLEYSLYGNSYQRVVSTLLFLTRHFGQDCGGTTLLNQKFTHNEIAILTGLCREVVSVEMGKLKARKLVSYKRGLVTVGDVKRLEAQLVTLDEGAENDSNQDLPEDIKSILSFIL